MTTSDADLQFCLRLLPEVSRTFALSITLLPEGLQPAVRTAYLLCRIVDCIEDEADLAPASLHALYDLFDAVMRDDTRDPAGFVGMARACHLGDVPSDRALVHDAGRVFRQYRALSATQRDAVRPWVLEMSRGMRETGERATPGHGLQVVDLPDLERYCWYVAGTVGHLLTELFLEWSPKRPDLNDEALHQLARSFGLGLQLVNIVKDVATDATRGVCFLPQDVLARHGVDRTTLLDPDHRDRSLAALREVCDVAHQHMNIAQRYLLAWPGEANAPIRLFCAVPLGLAIASLRLVATSADSLVPGSTPKISRELVMEVLARAQAGAASDEKLTALFDDLAGRTPATV